MQFVPSGAAIEKLVNCAMPLTTLAVSFATKQSVVGVVILITDDESAVIRFPAISITFTIGCVVKATVDAPPIPLVVKISFLASPVTAAMLCVAVEPPAENVIM